MIASFYQLSTVIRFAALWRKAFALCWSCASVILGERKKHSIKRRFNIVLLISILLPLTTFSQEIFDASRKNEINIELLGTGITHSINYERILFQKNKLEFKVKGGIHFNPIRIRGFYDYRTVGFNVEPKLNYVLGRHSVEIGVGYSYQYLFDIIEYEQIFGCCADLNLLIPRLGYRLYNKSRLRYWGISFTPIFTLDINEEGDEWSNNSFIPFGGISYGWKF